MAMELILNQSNYDRLEKDDKKLTAPNLHKIADALGVRISYSFEEKTSKVIHQNNNEKAEVYNVDTFIQADTNPKRGNTVFKTISRKQKRRWNISIAFFVNS